MSEPSESGALYLLGRLADAEKRVAGLRRRISDADQALGHIVQDAVNRLTEDSPMLLIDVRLLDGVVELLRDPPTPSGSIGEAK
jgi:hypothetical protein